MLAAAERAATPDRHAIELRISAEDPARDFVPVPGLVTRWREPGGPGVRVDSGLEQGWQVPGDYDPMLSKVLAVAPDREAALARARRAVDEFETGGVQTTLPFHAWLLAHPAFTEARLRTDMVERDWDPEPLRDCCRRARCRCGRPARGRLRQARRRARTPRPAGPVPTTRPGGSRSRGHERQHRGHYRLHIEGVHEHAPP